MGQNLVSARIRVKPPAHGREVLSNLLGWPGISAIASMSAAGWSSMPSADRPRAPGCASRRTTGGDVASPICRPSRRFSTTISVRIPGTGSCMSKEIADRLAVERQFRPERFAISRWSHLEAGRKAGLDTGGIVPRFTALFEKLRDRATIGQFPGWFPGGLAWRQSAR